MKVSRVLPLLACGLLVSACSKKSSDKKAPVAAASEEKADACPEINGSFIYDDNSPPASILVKRSETELLLSDSRENKKWIVSSVSEKVTENSRNEQFPTATDYIAKCFGKNKVLITYYAFPGSENVSTQMGRKHVDGFLSDTDNRFILGSVEYSIQENKIIVTTSNSEDETIALIHYFDSNVYKNP